MPVVTNAELASAVQQVVSRVDAREDQLTAWQAGTPEGGPFADGTYAITNLLGETSYFKSPARLQYEVGLLTTAGTGAVATAEAARDAAEAALASAVVQATNASSSASTASTKASEAQVFRNEAANSEANALAHRNAASASASAAALSEADAEAAAIAAASSAASADADATSAAASAAAAATFDPVNFYTKTQADTLLAAKLATADFSWNNLAGKPTTFTPSAHTHAISDVTGLQTALDGKQAAGSYAAASHTHVIADVTGLQAALDGKQPAGPYLTGITGTMVTSALGYTPYNATNPNGYISGITSGMVTTALGYTPYNSSNPAGYITGITSGNVTTALGYTPANKAGDTFSGSISSPSVVITGGGTYSAGSIYSDANWGMIFRAKQASPNEAHFLWTSSADSELLRIDNAGSLITPFSVRAPVFYDNNNTGYYVDPDGTSNLNAGYTNGQWKFRSNPGAGVYSGATANLGLQAYSDDGGAAQLSFHRSGYYAVNMGLDPDNYLRIGGWSASANRWVLDMAGNNWVASSYRAPLFYDSDDTGYYVNPNATSNLNKLTVAGYSVGCSQTINLSGLDQSTYYPVGIALNPTQTTRIKINVGLNSGTVPSWSTHPSGFTLVMDWEAVGGGWGTTTVQRNINTFTHAWASVNPCGGITQNTLASMEIVWLRGGGQYYVQVDGLDTSITAYTSGYSYGGQTDNPTTSTINDVWSSATGAGSSFAVVKSPTLYFNEMYYTPDGRYGIVGASAYFDTVNSGIDSDPLELCYVRGSEVHIGSGGSKPIKASVYYDGNDTSFYLDPHSISVLNTLYLRNGGIPVQAKFAQASQFGYSSSYRTVVLGNEYLTTISMGVDVSGNASGSFNGGGEGREILFRNGVSFITPNSANNGYLNPLNMTDGYVTSSGSFRAPIFYDSNNTGYYVDPASSAVLFGLELYGTEHKYLYINPGNGYEAMVRYNGGSGNTWYVGKRMAGDLVGTADFHFYSQAYGATVAGVDAMGNIFALSSLRAPSFYDSNNTGYYTDPASHSFLNTLGVYGGVSVLYNNPADRVDNAPWYGIGGTSSGTVQVAGWTGLRLRSSSAIVDLAGDYAQANGSFRAPIFYDTNDTGYYCDPNWYSQFNYVWANNWFRSNGDTGWYSQTYAGGIYMIDTTWVRVYNGKAFYVPNEIAATGNITAYYSDERLKTKTGTIDNALDKVSALEGFLYVENDLARSLGYSNKRQQVGVSAQAVKAVLPEAVSLAPVDFETLEDGTIISKSGEDYLTVDYSRIVPLLIEAIKELRAEVEVLKNT